MEKIMPWAISIIRLPLPKGPVSENSSEPIVFNPRHATTEEEALVHCRELIQKGCIIIVTGPENVRWDQNEICRRLN